MSNLARRASRATPLAFLLSLLLATQSAAATWTLPVLIARGGHEPGVVISSGAVIALDDSVAVVVYGRTNARDVRQVVTRRSADGGETWEPPVVIARTGWAPAIAGRGTSVDIVWQWDGRIWYVRSIDGGRAYDTPIALSPMGRRAGAPSVAHGPDGVVVVAWHEIAFDGANTWAGPVRVRVSTDSGESFARPSTVAQAGLYPRVAVGREVVYVAYAGADNESISVKRSLDEGESWSSRASFRAGTNGFDIAADGDDAYLVYEGRRDGLPWAIIARKTANRGTAWSQRRDVLPDDWYAYDPHVSLEGGVARVVFEACSFEWDICAKLGEIALTQSASGSNWTVPSRISSAGHDAFEPSISVGGRILVLYRALGRLHNYLYFRSAAR